MIQAAGAAEFRYVAYGIRIASDIELWSVQHREEPFDDWCEVAVLSENGALGDAELTSVKADEACFGWAGLAQIVVRGGSRIVIRAAQDADPREVAAAVSGPALAAVFGQQGLLVLHGTCVALDGRAVCLVGDSGAGKSTLAATLCDAGGALVSDTMTVLDLTRDAPTVRVGPPQYKLWPDAARALGYSPESLARALPGSEKRVCRFAGQMAGQWVPLAGVFVLNQVGAVSLARLPPAAAAVALLRNHFLVGHLDAGEQQRWLLECARVVERVSVSSLCRGQSRTDLPAAIAAIGGALKPVADGPGGPAALHSSRS